MGKFMTFNFWWLLPKYSPERPSDVYSVSEPLSGLDCTVMFSHNEVISARQWETDQTECCLSLSLFPVKYNATHCLLIHGDLSLGASVVPLSVLSRTQHWGARGLQPSSCGMMGELEQGREGGVTSTLVLSLVWETDGHVIETVFI